MALCLVVPSAALAEDESPPLSIYGFARLDVLVNDSRMSSLEDPLFVDREPETGRFDSELTMTPRLSRIGLSIDRWQLVDDAVTGEGKLEIDFAGGSGPNAIRLRHAYASIANERRTIELLAGQTWDLLSPLFPSAQNDSQLRYAGNIGDRRAQLRLTARPTNRLEVAIAAGAPAVLDPEDVDRDGQVDAMASGAPMLQWLIEGRARIGPDGQDVRLGLSGHVARTELGDGTTRGAASIGGHFFVPFGDFAVLLGEGYVGTAMAELGGGIGQGVLPMTGKLVHALGGWVELALLPSKRHMLAVGSSVDVASARDIEGGDRQRNGTVYEVLRYRPRPSLELGLEHLYWKTYYRGMSPGVANRIDVHLSVFF